MPIDIRRFGVGHRRPDGPSGSVGLTGQVLHSDGRGIIAELAFARNARIEPHSNPNTTYFIVVEGGGWVGVGDERTRIAAGEAALWPADMIHSAWTEHSEMRAFVVELAGADDGGAILGKARELAPGSAPVARGIGVLADRVPHAAAGRDPTRRIDADGEPL
ncbi:MAG TPA: cupin domain-containing protein [Candidatus Limnocylindrales bacterium]|nr:cupin domain-containing protein [Candidatus Limnocylindrales bacterium]